VGTTGTTSYADSGLLASTSYVYTVDAYDGSGNTSTQSQELRHDRACRCHDAIFVQVNNNQISSGTNVSVIFHAPTSAGNTLVVYVIWNNAGSVALTDSCGNTFVNVGGPVSWGNGYSAQTF
jgi:chitodextrinase